MIQEKLKPLYKRILDISFRHKLSHLGSCLTALPIIDEIFSKKKYHERFVLSSGHAGLALYVVLEKYRNPTDHVSFKTAEEIFNHHGVHPDRCEPCGIDCSSGSLGQGLPIAVGMALADRSKNVYCLISDGELAEGSCYEALNIAREQNVTNLNIYINNNGWGAYRKTTLNLPMSSPSPIHIIDTNLNGLPEWLQGQSGHYAIMSYDQYQEALRCLQ